jgi:F0F1-type ATP synthase membrane subunit b/b'
MDNETQIAERLEHAATLLEHTLAWLEERQTTLSGEVERISATVEQFHREEELAEKLAVAEREIAELRAAASTQPPSTQSGAFHSIRKTVPASTIEMLAKHGVVEGPVDVRALDAALAGLSLEQRIAVKSQLLRAGAIA